jgi:hypothetical protein
VGFSFIGPEIARRCALAMPIVFAHHLGEMATLQLQPGDRVRLTKENVDGVVVEVKTRSVVVRVGEPNGQSREHHVTVDDIVRLPTTKESLLERSSVQPVPVMTFAPDDRRWIAIDDAHVREDRVDGWFTALRTMYHELHSDGIEQSIGLLGVHQRRVLTLSAITGHDVFRKMKNAWDAYKTRAERHDIPEKRTLDIVRTVYSGGLARLDQEPSYVYAFVSVTSPPAQMPDFTRSAKALLDHPARVSGLQGGALFASDDDGREVLFTRWNGRAAAESFVNDARRHVVLPPTQLVGDEAEVYDVKAQLVP